MISAIVALENSLRVAKNNEPIWRAEGNIDQADLCLKQAADFQKALDVLNNYSEE